LYRSLEYERHLSEKIDAVLAEMMSLDVSSAHRLLMEKIAEHTTVSKSVTLLGLDRGEFYIRLARRVEVKKFVSPNPRVTAMLKRLRARSHIVVLHTNSGRDLARITLDALGMDDSCYDLIITSDDKEPKPSEEGYLHILAMTNAKPEEAIYVGDRFQVEVAPAKKLGMKTIFVGETSSAREADYTVNSVEEIENIVN